MDRQAQNQNNIKREIFDEVVAHLKKPEITLITGSRQVGKTVLLGQLKEFLIKEQSVKEENIFFYNLDLFQDEEVLQNQTNFIEFLKDRSQKQKIYVFVDEAQKTPSAARFFKGVYDSRLNLKLILTGSSSLELKAGFKESLAGRKRVFPLAPFSFLEFLRCRDKFLTDSLRQARKISRIDEAKIIGLYKEYLIYGGYPRVVLSKNQQERINILKEIYSSYIEKDIVGFLEIKNKTAFNRLVKLLAGQIGQLVNIGELAANLSIDRQTVERYILALEETFILKKINPYFTNPRQEIIKSGKVYFADLGLRNLALENFQKLDERIDRGSILEEAVLAELSLFLRNSPTKPHFWRTKQGAEVDFVIEKGINLLPIEVKFSLKKESISSGLRSFIKKFRPKKAAVANLSINRSGLKIEGTRIEFLYPFGINSFMAGFER